MAWLIAKHMDKLFLLPWPKHFGVVYTAFLALALVGGFSRRNYSAYLSLVLTEEV